MKQLFFDEIQKCPEIVTKIKFLVDEFIYQKLLQIFFIYLIVGGMSDAVKTYIAFKDIREVDKV